MEDMTYSTCLPFTIAYSSIVVIYDDPLRSSSSDEHPLQHSLNMRAMIQRASHKHRAVCRILYWHNQLHLGVGASELPL